jgi:hypothetical protein
MVADYGGDLPALARVREAAAPLMADPELGHLAAYWSGFAAWRSALNGANRGMAPLELRGHLEVASVDFETAVARQPDFADGHAAAAGVNGWLLHYYRDDAAKTARHAVLALMRLRQATRLAPDSPRLLWVDASFDLFTPPALGGDPARALATYQRILDLPAAPAAVDGQPDWGRAEAMMSLAWLHSPQGPFTDPEAARREAREALRLAPGWSYVRDVLLPSIESAAARPPRPSGE